MKAEYNSNKKERIIDDKIGNTLLHLIPRKKRTKPTTINNILIYKLGSIGDSILALPMIKELQEKTKTNITVVHSKENEMVFNKQPFIKKTILLNITGKNHLKNLKTLLIDIKKERADISIDLSQTSNLSALFTRITGRYSIGFHNKNTKKRNNTFDKTIPIKEKEHIVHNYYDIITPITKTKKEFKTLQPLQYEKKDEKILEQLPKKRNLVGIHCAHQILYKSWPAKRFAKIITYLQQKNKTIILLGSPKEEEQTKKVLQHLKKKNKNNIINLVGKTTITELATIMKKLELLIANDGGVMHLGTAMNTPTIGIFIAETPQRYAPYHKGSIAVYKKRKEKDIIKTYEKYWPTNNNTKESAKEKEVIEAIEYYYDNLYKEKKKQR